MPTNICRPVCCRRGQSLTRCSVDSHSWHFNWLPSGPIGFPLRPKPMPLVRFLPLPLLLPFPK